MPAAPAPPGTIGAGVASMSQTVAAPLSIRRFAFTGRTDEYFRIWAVSLCLSLLTLGAYSAWGKVRKRRYLYAHTRFDGSGFDYRALPVAILKGRIIAVLLFGGFALSGHFLPQAQIAFVLLLLLLTPWIVVASSRFNARNSAYRNVAFAFDGTLREATKVMLGYGTLAMVTLGIAYPWFRMRRARFIVGRHRIGATPFKADLPAGGFIVTYLLAALMLIGAGVLMFGALLAIVGLTAADAEPTPPPAGRRPGSDHRALRRLPRRVRFREGARRQPDAQRYCHRTAASSQHAPRTRPRLALCEQRRGRPRDRRARGAVGDGPHGALPGEQSRHRRYGAARIVPGSAGRRGDGDGLGSRRPVRRRRLAVSGFDGVLFDGLATTAVPVRVEVHADDVTIADGTVTARVPRARVVADAPIPGVPRTLRLPEGERVETDDHAAVTSIWPEHGAVARAGYAIESRWWAVLGCIAITAACIWFIVAVVLPLGADPVARHISPEVELYLGKRALASLDATVLEAVATAGRGAARMARQVRSIRCRRIGRCALCHRLPPCRGAECVRAARGHDRRHRRNGRCRSAGGRSLLAVLAHEIGHVRGRHAMRLVLQNSGVAVLMTALAGDAVGVTFLAIALPSMLLQSGYTRQFEAEADDYAFAHMKRHDVSPQAFADALRSLERETGRSDDSAVSRYLGTHPATAERIRRAEGAR